MEAKYCGMCGVQRTIKDTDSNALCSQCYQFYRDQHDLTATHGRLKLFRIMVASLPKGTPAIYGHGAKRNHFLKGMVMYVLGEDEESTIEYFRQHNHMDAWLKNVEESRIKIDEVVGPYKHGFIIDRREFGV